MLKITLPERNGFYADCISHPNQDHPARAQRLLRRLRQPSQCRQGGRALGRLHARRSRPAPAEESRRHRELFARASRRTVGPAVRRGVQPDPGRIHPEHLRCVHEEGVSHATRNDRTRPHGRQHGAAASGRRAPVRGLRPVAQGSGGVGEGQGRRGLVARRHGEEAGHAAGGLADGPGRGRGRDHRRPAAAPLAGRHPHRRRELLLRRRHPAREGARGEAHPLRGRRDQRRRLGTRARLLPDDRRRAGGGEAPRSDFRAARTRQRRRASHSGARTGRRHRRARVPPLRTERRRALREDGAQRDRVRAHGRIRGRPGHPTQRQRRHPGLSEFSGRVSDSGEGRWTLAAAIDEGVPSPVLSAALYQRFSSRGEGDFENRVLSAMRFAFGGHLEKSGGSSR